MRTLVVGDIHADVRVPDSIDKAASATGAGHVVVLGDCIDPVWPPFEDPRDDLNAFLSIVRWAQRRGDVTLLIGNHEADYLMFARSGMELQGALAIAPEVFETIMTSQGLFAWAYAVDGWLLTHAGLSEAWARMAGIADGLSAREAAVAINERGWSVRTEKLPDSGPSKGSGTKLGSRRGGEEHPLDPGPLGGRRVAKGKYVSGPLAQGPRDLLAGPYLVDQAVGHTAVETIRLLYAKGASAGSGGVTVKAGVRLAFCDTMTMRTMDGRRTGDSSFLLLDNGYPLRVRDGRRGRVLPVTRWVEPDWGL